MTIQRLRCTSCGADFENIEAEQQVFRCTRKGCGAVFLVEQGKKFSDIEEMKAQQIQKLREGLKNSLQPFHAEQVRLYAKEILAMIPEDYRARAALCLEVFQERGLLRLQRSDDEVRLLLTDQGKKVNLEQSCYLQVLRDILETPKRGGTR